MRVEMKPELIYYAKNSLLEGPLWDAANQLFYFIAIEDQMIYSLNEETYEIKSYPTESPVGAAALTGDGRILSAEKDGIFTIDIESSERRFVAHPNADQRMRYNDGKWDPKGRFLVGTMGYTDTFEGAASLYVIEEGKVRELLSNLTLSNGLGWSQDGRTFYHIDTPTNTVMQYDYHLEKAELSNARQAVEITDGGSPDGMCVDIDDHIWVAEYGGKRICKWNPETGKQVLEIPMPVSNITSCCIGGRDKDMLYITTAQEDGEPLSGGLFKVKIR